MFPSRFALRVLLPALFLGFGLLACGGNVVVDPGHGSGTGGAGSGGSGVGANSTTNTGTTGTGGGPSDACGSNGPVNPAACVTNGATCMAPMGQFCFEVWDCENGTWGTSTECEGGG